MLKRTSIPRPVVWGISFDATPISGVIVEFIKLARVFFDRGYRVHLDLGYDIKEDKNRFFAPYRDEAELLPSWVHLDRIDHLDQVAGYQPSFVASVLRDVVQREDGIALAGRIESVHTELCQRIVRKWRELGVSFVIVENGTLPENVTYTKALYAAIEIYGRENALGRYVLWRDHDLMWSSEAGIEKYGKFPYRGTVKPVNSPHIQYIALHEDARRRTLEWAPHLENIAILNNAFDGVKEPRESNGQFRKRFGIPDDAFLMARYTRIIPQKRIDRDICLLAKLNTLLETQRAGRQAYLFVAGDVDECPSEHDALVRYAESLGTADRVIFGGWLLPHEPYGARKEDGAQRFSVRDLLGQADLASFLTSHDYESYGNPIGEAAASGVPYITTRYEFYEPVYGSKGFRAPVMDPLENDRPTDAFAAEVAHLLMDEDERRAVAQFNLELAKAHFAPDHARKLVDEKLFGRTAAASTRDDSFIRPMRPETRLSVVLPVYNEEADIVSVLQSLYEQQSADGAFDRQLYEIIVVDNNSTDDTVRLVRMFGLEHPDLDVYIVREAEQGVACARKRGMDVAALRSRERDEQCGHAKPFYLVSADADCRVERTWLSELYRTMETGRGTIAVCNYYYPAQYFLHRPRLWAAIDRTLRCRELTFTLFGGFPDGKGFAVLREVYEKVGGIEIFYQLREGRFLNHLSDDWDFGIKVRASGEEIVYAPASRVEINPRRVDHALDEVIEGRAYGEDGIITMRNIRPREGEISTSGDLTVEQAERAWAFSIKDFTPKNTILPVLLTPSMLERPAVLDFFTPSLAERLGRRIAEIQHEMRMIDFLPIHAYKTPSYRLYFEFADEIFARLRATVGNDIGHPPPLPPCLEEIRSKGDPKRFRDFVYYYCEDRESGEAHNYFGNGGVF